MNRREFLMTTTAGVGVTAASGSVLASDNEQQGRTSSQPEKSVTIDAYCAVGIDREYNLTESALLSAMDKAGVERAVIAPPDRFLTALYREGNESIRKIAATHRTRFIPACSVNPWFGKQAIEELRRALGEGGRVAVLHPFVQGFLANDELTFPFVEEAGRAKVPVYVHTGPPGNSTPWKVVDLSERFPDVDFIMGHCGATDFWNDVIPALKSSRNVYGESSLARPFNFASYVEAVGSKRGVHGSFAPINDFGFEWEQMQKFLPPAFHADVFGNNLQALLLKRGPL